MSLTDNLKEKTLYFFYGVLGFSTSVWSKVYGLEKGNSFLVSYAHDVSGPFAFYFANRLLFEFAGFPFGKNKLTTAATVFTYCSAIEIEQGLGLTKGTYDPYDFLTYAVGVGLAVGVDHLTSGKRKKKSESI